MPAFPAARGVSGPHRFPSTDHVDGETGGRAENRAEGNRRRETTITAERDSVCPAVAQHLLSRFVRVAQEFAVSFRRRWAILRFAVEELGPIEDPLLLGRRMLRVYHGVHAEDGDFGFLLFGQIARSPISSSTFRIGMFRELRTMVSKVV